MVREILLLGNPQLYEVSKPVTEDDAAQLPAWIATCATRCTTSGTVWVRPGR